MAIRRKYGCHDCGLEFWSWDPIEEAACPQCSKKGDWVPGIGGITGVRTKNQDAITDGLMSQFGITDMQDRQREGDVAQKLTPAQQMMVDRTGGSMFQRPQGDIRAALSGYDLGPKEERGRGMAKAQKAAKENPIPVTRYFA